MPRSDHGKTVRIDLLVDAETGLPLRRDMVARPSDAAQPTRSNLPICCRALLQSFYDGVIITDINGRIVEFNNRALHFLRYGYEELCQLNIFDVVSGADAGLLATVQENLQKLQFTLLKAYCHRKDGSFFPAEIVISQSTLEGAYLTFFIRDISIRRQAEEQLLTEHAALQNAANGIAITDQTGHIIYVNPAMAQMWDYRSSEKMCGRALTELFAEPAVAGQTISANLSSNETWIGELRARRRSGEEFSVQISAALNRNPNDELMGLVFSFIDVSDRLRANATQQEAERQRVMIESFGTACHHLGQPATVLMANLELLNKQAATLPEELRKQLSDAVQAAETIRDLLQKLNAAVLYRPTPYSAPASEASAADSHILEI